MSRKLTYDFVKKYIENEKYTLLSKTYIDAKTKLLVQCNYGHEPYYVAWFNFKTGHRCPECNITNRKNALDDIRAYAEKRGYKVISTEYKNRNKKLEMICPKGHTTFISWGNFSKGRRCSECYRFKKLTSKEVKNFLNYFGYDLIGEYKTANRKINILCPSGHIYQGTYAHFYDGKRCPYCKKSKGALRVANFLQKTKYDFKEEYYVKNILGATCLRFDFYIPELNMAIEYDGQQHYKPIEKFGGEKAFEKTKFRDVIKNNYCKDNNINLLRIPYWDYNNIEKILNDYLKENFND